MAAIIQITQFQTSERKDEAHAMAEIRKACEDAGLSPHATQLALHRARESYRRSRSALPAILALSERAKSDRLSPFTLLHGLQAAMRELWNGRSGATAVQAGYRAMRPQTMNSSDHGPTAA